MNRRTLHISLIAAIAACGLLFAWCWWYSGLRTVPSGSRIGAWKIGGLTVQQFQEQWEARLARLNARPIRFELPDGSAAGGPMTLGQLGLTTNGAELTKQIAAQLEGSRAERIRRRWRGRNTEWPLKLGIAEESLRQTLTAAWPERMNPPTQNAQRIITADDRVEYKPEQRAWTVDTAELARLLGEAAYGAFAQDAAAGTSGLSDPPPELTIRLPMKEVVPDLTVEKLKAQGIERKIAEFSTQFPASAPGRVHNIRVTAGTIHDMLLAPGQRFDYGAVIRETEKRYGFREAPVIYNGKLVPGIGGGICQVSTTLYNAVLRAGLKIDERRNHSLPVSYVPLGQDATFASGYINFVFTNSSDRYLLIRTETKGNRVTVKLFGHLPENVTYDVESNIVQTLNPPVKYVHNPSLPRGGSVVLQQGKPGYVVETYRIRKENGAVVGKERVSRDTYQPQPVLVAVNNGNIKPDGEAPAPNGQIIEDGISGPHFPKGR
jgi:vancomycin resistance protein YoaR